MFKRNSFYKILISVFIILFSSSFANVVLDNKRDIHNNILVDYIYSIGCKIPKEIIKEIVKNTLIFSNEYSISPFLILSIIKEESCFKTNITNKNSTAFGLMQVIPRYHNDIIKGQSLYGVKNNIKIGVGVLDKYIKKYKDTHTALLGYSGFNYSYPKKVLNLKNKMEIEFLNKLFYHNYELFNSQGENNENSYRKTIL